MGFATRSRGTRLGVEPLDSRVNPSGNVAVSFGEVLELRGDAAGNNVLITQCGIISLGLRSGRAA